MNAMLRFLHDRDEKLAILARSWILFDRIQWFCIGAIIGGSIVAIALKVTP